MIVIANFSVLFFNVTFFVSDQPPNSANSEKQGSSVRKILDQRRQLVMQFFADKGLFPSSKSSI